MWLQLGNDYLNLNHVVRARFNKGFKNGQEEWVAEVETILKGEVTVFTRYRGPDAQRLNLALNALTVSDEWVSVPATGDPNIPVSSPLKKTLHDIQLP